MNDRMRLAEAMGWKWRPYPEDTMGELESPNGQIAYCTRSQTKYHLPDPFTDANDDYSILEWMRTPVLSDNCTELDWRRWCEFVSEMHRVDRRVPRPSHYSRVTMYQIGDYARAALKVLDDE